LARRLDVVNTNIGVSLDFYNTLVEIDRDAPTMAQALSTRGYPCSAQVEAIWNSHGFDGQHTNDSKQTSYDAWRRRALGSLVALCGATQSEAGSLVDELLRLDQTWTVKARPGAGELLAWLRHRGLPHCILTNWDYPIASYLAMADLPKDLLSITSAELGLRKPLEAAFAQARRSLGVSPGRHIHIGDSWRADVVGAIRSGAWAIWVTESLPADPLPRRIRVCTSNSLLRTLSDLIEDLGRL
jgi:FMN phosphatase YigB (HAD superfamily)